MSTATNLPNSNHILVPFSSGDANAERDSFSATVDWGDGTTTAGTVAAQQLFVSRSSI